jgi:Tfp pilus assembly protein PilF
MSTRFTEIVVCGLVAAMLAACQSAPRPAATAEACAGGAATCASAPSDVDKKSLALFQDALAAMTATRWSDAEALLGELVEREPKLSGPWVNLGIVQSELGRDDAAEVSFRTALERNPGNCAALTELGLLRRRAGDFLAAEANYLACVQRVPDFREAHLNLGILYELYLGRLPEALDAYRAYLALIDGEDRRVAGWVSDLERRLATEKDS